MQAIDAISRSESQAAAARQESAQAPDSLHGAFQQALDEAREEHSALPVEAYSLPDWYADLVPDQCVLSPCINHAYWDQAEAFSADGSLSGQEKAVLKSMLDNDQQRKTEMANAAWREEHREELAEYFDILHGYLVESLRENEVDGAEDYYESVVLDPAGSEQVRRSFMERLAADPRALELMEGLGVSRPALPA